MVSSSSMLSSVTSLSGSMDPRLVTAAADELTTVEHNTFTGYIYSWEEKRSLEQDQCKLLGDIQSKYIHVIIN